MSFPLKFDAVVSLSGAIGASYTTLISSIPRHTRQLIITNSLDAAVMLSFDGGTTDHLPLLANQSFVFNLDDQDTLVHAGSALQVKDIGTTSSGTIYASVLKAD